MFLFTGKVEYLPEEMLHVALCQVLQKKKECVTQLTHALLILPDTIVACRTKFFHLSQSTICEHNAIC